MLRKFKCSSVSTLKFLIIFEQGTHTFHFALGSTNYVASPASEPGSQTVQLSLGSLEHSH